MVPESKMREILFRGKRTKNGEWVYGYYYRDDENGKTYIITWEPNTGTTWAGSLEIENFVEVIPETVGQFTGLTDKNGKRIFEGDILRHHNNFLDSEVVEKGVVFWDEKYCGWRRTSNGGFHNGIVDAYRLSPDCVYGVIGNIHDNPELLEVSHG